MKQQAHLLWSTAWQPFLPGQTLLEKHRFLGWAITEDWRPYLGQALIKQQPFLGWTPAEQWPFPGQALAEQRSFLGWAQRVPLDTDGARTSEDS